MRKRWGLPSLVVQFLAQKWLHALPFKLVSAHVYTQAPFAFLKQLSFFLKVLLPAFAMPKKIMKAAKKKEQVWPAPKKGKTRASIKSCTTMKKCKPVPYVRHTGVQKKFRKEKTSFGVSVQGLTSMRPRASIRQLQKDKMLPKWTGNTCPHCGVGKLGPLRFSHARKVWTHKCGAKPCRKFLQPQDFHPIFFNGNGASTTSLGQQAAVLCCALAGAPVSSAPIILERNHKPVARIYTNLEIARSQHVIQKQKHIKFGAKQSWSDVEADEVDVGKEVETKSNTARWEQWGGIVERGQPSTLVLFRFPSRRTAARSPGPGPITKRDWKPMAQKYLEGRNIILHTDGAKAYKLKLRHAT